jgi:hypothetical protein
MGVAAAAFAGQVIVSVLVSQIATEVAKKVGMSDSMAGLVGLASGMGAGFAAGTAMAAPAAGGSTAGTTAGAATKTATYGGAAGSPGMAPGAPGAVTGPGNPMGSGFAGNGPPIGNAGSGMLSQSAPSYPSTPPPGTVASPSSFPNTPPPGLVPGDGNTASNLVGKGTVGAVDTAGKSWAEKLFTPEKTMDLIMAGAGGYAKAGMAKDDREYQEQVAKDNEKEWNPNGVGINSIRTPYRTQNGSY